MQWFSSLLFTALLFVSTLVYSCVLVAGFWLPYATRHSIVRHWARAQLRAARLICGLDYVVEGREHILPGAHISYWKHSSTWETIAQAVIFPPQAWVLKREILWIPIIGWATWLMRPIAINRAAASAAVSQVVSQGRARLAAGVWVLVFPEGTRVAVGERRRYGISGALLAVETGAHIVPVAHDAGRYWGRRGLLKRRGTIRVVIGPPIDPTGREPREINELARAWIDSKVSELGA